MPIFDPIPQHATEMFTFDAAGFEKTSRFVKSYHHYITDFLPSHTHDFYEINIICEGVGKHQLEHREILAQKGDVFIIPAGTKHGYSSNSGMDVFHILLSPVFCDAYAPLLKKMRGYEMMFDLEPLLREHIDTAYYLKSEDIAYEQLKNYIELIGSDGDGSGEAARIAHTLSLIATLAETFYSVRPIDLDTLQSPAVPTVLQSVGYIEKNCCSHINFKQLSFESALSYSTYLRYFRSVTGTTPQKYQTACRIKTAANMLIGTDDSILSVALACGFYDSSHFIKEFIRHKGVSPTDFRKQSRS